MWKEAFAMIEETGQPGNQSCAFDSFTNEDDFAIQLSPDESTTSCCSNVEAELQDIQNDVFSIKSTILTNKLKWWKFM